MGRILLQQKAHQIGGLGRHPPAVEFGRLLAHDPADDGMDRLVGLVHERHRTQDGGQEADTDAVDVGGDAGLGAAQDLWCSVGHAGCDGGRSGVGAVLKSGDSEIAEHGLTRRPHQDVFRLEVTMEDT